jgi:hypothetical protein
MEKEKQINRVSGNLRTKVQYAFLFINHGLKAMVIRILSKRALALIFFNAYYYIYLPKPV